MLYREFKGKVMIYMISRSSRSQMFFKKVVLLNFLKITGKHLCQSPFYNKVPFFNKALSLQLY